nr:uncharacterized protein LOC127318683 [Lolium perenne]
MAATPLRDTVPLEEVQLESDLTYEEKPVKILETAERVTRTKTIKFYFDSQFFVHHSDDAIIDSSLRRATSGELLQIDVRDFVNEFPLSIRAPSSAPPSPRSTGTSRPATSDDIAVCVPYIATVTAATFVTAKIATPPTEKGIPS